MNRIIAISMVKNEADIIESMVRYTLNYADYLLIKEHNSTDDTRKILELLKEEGLALEIYDCDIEGHNQSDVMTELVYKAIKEFNADVVVPLDADEFLISEKGTVNDVRSSLENLDIRGNYDIPWINFCIAEEGIQQQDKHVAGFAYEANKAMVIVVNKWDLVKKSETAMVEFTKKIRERKR